MNRTIALVAVGYNRVDSITRLLNSLNQAYYDEAIDLIISIDKSETEAVENYADIFTWKHGNKIVDKHDANLGLRNHMMSLSKWFDKYNSIVVLEDDIVVSANFYSYVKQTTAKYIGNQDIAGISLYSFSINYQTYNPFCPCKDEHDVFFMQCAMSWGQVWMREKWMDFYNWYLNNIDFGVSETLLPNTLYSWPKSSWLKYHTRYCIENKKYFVYPYVSYSTNYGDSGTHHKKPSTLYQVELQMGNPKELILPSNIKSALCYDGFFENLGLHEYLGTTPDNCCIDINGEKNNREGKKYWLTMRKGNYIIKKSYGLNYRPIELNIILNNAGSDIYLYDTDTNSVINNEPQVINHPMVYFYYLPNVLNFIKRYGLKNILAALLDNMKLKLHK